MKNIYVGTPWKMNKTVSESCNYIAEMCDYINKNSNNLKSIEIFILPSFLAVDACMKIVRGKKSALKIGAQNCCWEDFGSFTGEVSPMHLKDLGVSYVELGHAERRDIFMEDDEMIGKKVAGVIRNNLKPILCIGEEEKPNDINIALKFLKKQLEINLSKITDIDLKNIIIAYEPVWAIGASTSAPLDYIEAAIDFLRGFLNKEYGKDAGENQVIIYGGSVTPQSAEGLLMLPNNDGIFIGRAALNLDYFIKMIEMAVKVQQQKNQ